tara:strand:- start:14234 stop:15304 length:1071 start_codon:yes stop_codon:yes gene_type:complete
VFRLSTDIGLFAGKVIACAAMVGCGVAQAPKLDDPQHTVFHAFPAANSYRVIVRDVDVKARKRVEQSLPFLVHFDELGTHSLYVAHRDRRPIGMVYVQYEESAFGLTAVEWALNFDYEVVGFRFQRVRSRVRSQFVKSEFVRLLRGKSFADLGCLIDGDGSLSKQARGVVPGTEKLAASVVRSGMRTIAVLDTVWGDEVTKLRDRHIGLRSFPQARYFVRLWPQPETKAPKPKPKPKPKPQPGAAPAVEVQTPRRPVPKCVKWALQAYGKEGKLLGVAADVVLDEKDDRVRAFVVVGLGGRLIRAEASPITPDQIRAACSAVRGRALTDFAKDGDHIETALHELNTMLGWQPQQGR